MPDGLPLFPDLLPEPPRSRLSLARMVLEAVDRFWEAFEEEECYGGFDAAWQRRVLNLMIGTSLESIATDYKDRLHRAVEEDGGPPGITLEERLEDEVRKVLEWEENLRMRGEA